MRFERAFLGHAHHSFLLPTSKRDQGEGHFFALRLSFVTTISTKVGHRMTDEEEKRIPKERSDERR
jgi:hypothetical protein